MSGEGAPRLLARDRDQLNDVAAAIREGQRHVVFIVCDAPLRPVALDYLREQTQQSIPDPVALVEPDQTLQALTEIEGLGPADVRSLLVVHTAPDVMRTLNWHREKLRRGGAVLLWIEGIDGLRVLRQLGPDAYSFRDGMVMIQGEMPVIVAPAQEESVDVQLARLRYIAAETPVGRVVTAALLVEELQARGMFTESRTILEQALSEFSKHVDREVPGRLIRAQLCRQMGDLVPNSAHAFRWFNRGLAELNDIESFEATIVRIGFLASMPSAVGVDSTSALRALAQLQDIRTLVPLVELVGLLQVLMAVAVVWTLRGDMVQAHKYLHEAQTIWQLHSANRSAILIIDALRYIECGRFENAMATLHSASKVFEWAGLDTFGTAKLFATCHRLMGELDAARHILEALGSSGRSSVASSAKTELAQITLQSDVRESLVEHRAILQDALASQNDAQLLTTSDNFLTSLILAHEAQQATDSDITDALAELDIAESVACSIAGDDPPWYSILFPALRAELLELHPDTIEQAITLVSTALDRARTVFEDAVPKLARQLVHHLLQAGHLDRARTMLPAVINEVAAVRHLRELARLRAYHIVALIRTDAPIADVDPAMHVLRETFSEMDAPRIAADTLLELAEMLPASSKHVDPYALADEASSLYAEMPYPIQEARALEVMGDVLAARGNADEALRCYRSSRGICERFGFGLRICVLDKKIAANTASLVKP